MRTIMETDGNRVQVPYRCKPFCPRSHSVVADEGDHFDRFTSCRTSQIESSERLFGLTLRYFGPSSQLEKIYISNAPANQAESRPVQGSRLKTLSIEDMEYNRQDALYQLDQNITSRGSSIRTSEAEQKDYEPHRTPSSRQKRWWS